MNTRIVFNRNKKLIILSIL